MSETVSVEPYDISQQLEEMSPIEAENLEGNEAGRVFAQRHIIDKINTFLDVYRREGYSENYIHGFLDGINDSTGANIGMHVDDEDDEETDENELTTAE
jgi:hypothetical protein